MTDRKTQIGIGISIGIVLSLIMITFKWTIPFTWHILFILPISFFCGLVNKKWTCLSYSLPVLYLLNQVDLYSGSHLKFFEVPYAPLMIFIGIMHIIEGFMAVIYGPKHMAYTVGYKGNRKVEGYQTYIRWLIPLFLFNIKNIVIPIIIIMVYADDTLSNKPKQKFRMIGSYMVLYGIIVTLGGCFISIDKMALAWGMMFMPILHELLFVADERIG